MADWHEFFGEYGARENGGGARALEVFRTAEKLPWTLAPELVWEVEVTHRDLTGPAVVSQLRNLAFTAGQATDGTLRLTFSGDALDEPVVVDVVIAAADDATAISGAVETAIDAEGDLAGVLVATTDNGGDVDIEMSSFVDIDAEWVPDQQIWEVQFGGVIANGNFDTTCVFEGYNPIVTRTTRAGGTPTDAAALAVQHEADFEAKPELVGLLVSADDDGSDTNALVFEVGAPDVSVTCSAPAGSTLTPTETTGAVTVVQTDLVTVDLNTLAPRGAYPSSVERGQPAIVVVETFGAGRTIILGDDGALDALMGDTPITLNALGRTAGDPAADEQGQYEAAYVPLATFDIGNPATLTAGRVVIEIEWSPTP